MTAVKVSLRVDLPTKINKQISSELSLSLTVSVLLITNIFLLFRESKRHRNQKLRQYLGILA